MERYDLLNGAAKSFQMGKTLSNGDSRKQEAASYCVKSQSKEESSTSGRVEINVLMTLSKIQNRSPHMFYSVNEKVSLTQILVFILCALLLLHYHYWATSGLLSTALILNTCICHHNLILINARHSTQPSAILISIVLSILSSRLAHLKWISIRYLDCALCKGKSVMRALWKVVPLL